MIELRYELDWEDYFRLARAAARKRDRVTVEAQAGRFVAERHWWREEGTLGWVRFEPDEAAMIMLSGRGPEVIAAIRQRLLYVDANPDGSDRVRPYLETPIQDLNNYSLFELAWMRIVAREWASVPSAQLGHGPLVVGNSPREYLVIRGLLSAFESRDNESMRAAVQSAARLTGARKFSLFGLAPTDEARWLNVNVGLDEYDL